MTRQDERGLLDALSGDGRPLLNLMAVGLLLAGLGGIFLAATGDFLPHDLRYLEMPLDHL